MVSETLIQIIMAATAAMSSGEEFKAQPEPAPLVREAKRTLKEGDCGLDVANLNRELRSFGALRSFDTRGECFDEKTRLATETFQRYAGLDPDAVVGPRTRRKLQKTKKIRLARVPGWSEARSGLGEDYFLVSLERQLLFVVRDGRIRLATIASSGKPGYDTPTGVYSVYLKDPMSWSNPYSVWMPWAVYFNGGIAMHESDSVPAYPASHGCVRLPSLTAEQVYNASEAGDTVAVL